MARNGSLVRRPEADAPRVRSLYARLALFGRGKILVRKLFGGGNLIVQRTAHAVQLGIFGMGRDQNRVGVGRVIPDPLVEVDLGVRAVSASPVCVIGASAAAICPRSGPPAMTMSAESDGPPMMSTSGCTFHE